MSFTAEQIWGLLPAHIRVADTQQANPVGPDDQGLWQQGPLRQLVGVLADQIAVLEEELDQLYDNQFVETAAEWALAYLGDLLGIRGLAGRGTLGRSARSEIGHTVAYRRRKGTAPVLELVAYDLTGWPARAVEFFDRLASTQWLNHLRPHAASFASLHQATPLELVDGPFESLTRTAEVRRIQSGRGKWNLPNVGLFCWRLQAYALTQSPLRQAPWSGRHRRFDPLGRDLALVNRPQTEPDPTHLAEPANVPIQLTRRQLVSDTQSFQPKASLYGPKGSFLIEACPAAEGIYRPVPASQIVVCDLSDLPGESGGIAWAHEDKARNGVVAVDPQLGRVVFPEEPVSSQPPRASFHYAAAADLGGGEYDRAHSFDAASHHVLTVARTGAANFASIRAALDRLTELEQSLGPDTEAGGLVIEITDSGTYVEDLGEVRCGAAWEIRCADQRRATLILTSPLTLEGNAGSQLTLNGLLLAGESLAAGPGFRRLRLRHCTLAAGLEVDEHGRTPSDRRKAFNIEASNTEVECENCLLPALRVASDVRVHLRNCLVDAGSVKATALSGRGQRDSWNLENCTIVGKVEVDSLELATNTIFLAASVRVQRRQEGCVRFSWLPHDTVCPRRYRCASDDPGLDSPTRPHFTSLAFGNAAYGQLGRACPDAIRRGADDGGEMGVFHDLYQPHREAYLRHRLAEYLPFGLEAGLCPVT